MQAIAFEMEFAGVLSACTRAGIPVVLVKGICDMAGVLACCDCSTVASICHFRVSLLREGVGKEKDKVAQADAAKASVDALIEAIKGWTRIVLACAFVG